MNFSRLSPSNFAFPALKETIVKLMHKASLPAVFLLGGLVGIFEFPCAGGPYLMVLGIIIFLL